MKLNAAILLVIVFAIIVPVNTPVARSEHRPDGEYATNLQVAETVLYVAPDGDDANTGTLQAPLQTFEGARNRVRTLLDGSGDITVYFREGTYRFTSTVVLGLDDSGTASQVITYAAYEGETPVFSSLIQVTGWSRYDDNIMQANLPAGVNHVRYLQDASEPWLERSATARFTTTEPAGGEDGGCIECNNYTPSTQPDMSNIWYELGFAAPDWSQVAQYDLRASTLPWHQDILPLASVNPESRRIFTAVPALYDLRQDTEEVAPQAWVLNSLAGIDTPGEWASLDGKIYLYPISGTDDIYVPTLTELIRIDDGTVDGNTAISRPVSHIAFDGITFTGGDFRIVQRDDVTVQHDWMVVDEPDALLRIRNASHITVQNCTFTKSGGTGIRVDRYGQQIRIINNALSYFGRNGIGLVGRGPGYGDVNRNNEISYNHLEHIGMEKWSSVAIVIDQSSSNHVHHNVIANTYFTGIAVIGTRQLALAAWVEGADDFYVGREFHFYEVAPSVVAFAEANGGVEFGSQEAMRFVYNYNNRIEENALLDVATGQDIFINGQIYVSGLQRSTSPDDIKTNHIERNYLYDSFNHSTNDYALYSDSDQDASNYIGNMIIGVQNADNQPEPAPIILAFNQWAESETEGMGQITLRANVTENATFCNDEECSHTLGFDYVEEGQIINGRGGSTRFVSHYEQMYRAICDENFPQITALSGAQVMRDRLAGKIHEFGGIVPGDCESVPPSGAWHIVDDRDAGIVYSGSWTPVSYATASQGTVMWVEADGATATYTFAGTQVRVYIWQFEDAQDFSVYVDGVFQQVVVVEAGDETSYLAWESPPLSPGNHTVRIDYTSTELHLDGFEYLVGSTLDN